MVGFPDRIQLDSNMTLATTTGSGTVVTQKTGRSRLRRTVFRIVIVAAVLFPFLLENLPELVERYPLGFVGEILGNTGALYQRLVTLSPQPLESRYVAVLSLDEKSRLGYLLHDACGMRKYVAKLLPALIRTSPSVLVLDISFWRDNCSSGGEPDAINKNLIRVINSTAASVPVLVAQTGQSTDDFRDEDVERLRKAGLSASELVVKPALLPIPRTIDGHLDNRGPVYFGLTKFDNDLRKIPVEWLAFPSEQEVRPDNLQIVPSLAFEAAILYRATFPDRGARLRELANFGRHPYTSFLRAKQFTVVSADSFCGTSTDLGDCNPDARSETFRDLRSRIIFVGGNSDLQSTVVGKMPGVLIHANYVESLLDGRYLKPVSYGWQLLLACCWFAAVQAPFLLRRNRPKLGLGSAVAFSLLIWIAIAIFIYYFAVINLGFYLSLFVPSLIAIIARACDIWAEEH